MSRYPGQPYAGNQDFLNLDKSASSENGSFPFTSSTGYPPRPYDIIHHERPSSASSKHVQNGITLNPIVGIRPGVYPNSVQNNKMDLLHTSESNPLRSSFGRSMNQLTVEPNTYDYLVPTTIRRASLISSPTEEKLYPGVLKSNFKAEKGHLSINPVSPQLQTWFKAVDTDNSGQITSQELQKALVNGNYSSFSVDACRMMIDMYDRNCSGSIDLDEFQHLFDSINEWKSIFEGYDKDKSRTIEHSELCDAFQQMGYGLSSDFVQDLLVKYSPRTKKLTLDNFIVMCVQLKRVSDGFRSRDQSSHGRATLRYEDFVGLAMGLHH